MSRPDWDKILDVAETEVDAVFADELAKFTTLTTTEVQKLYPRKIDKKRFAQLMKIVNSSASRNNRVALLKNNFDSFGGAVMRLLEQFT